MVLAGSVIGTIQNIPEQDSWHPLAHVFGVLVFFRTLAVRTGSAGINLADMNILTLHALSSLRTRSLFTGASKK